MRKLLVAALLLIAASPPPTADETGPAPVLSEAVPLIEQAVRASLVDPGSAQFEWPYGFTAGALKAPFGHRHIGWITCGMVNARNRMGGYTGRSFFQVVLHNGAIDMLDIGNSSDDVDIVGASCAKMIKDNFLQPAPAPQASASISPAAAMAMLQQMVTANEARGMESAKAGMANGGYGFSAVATPYGVSIMAVAPGSRAATAGLKAGQDVLEINGKSTVGLTNDQFIALIHSKPAQGFDLKISNAPSVHLPPL